MDNKKFPTYLKITIVWTILTSIFIFAPVLNDTFLRIVFAWTLILFLPGYVLIAFLFPEKKDMDLIERVALSVGLSAAITPILGLILNFTPFGIRLIPIIIILSSFIVILTILTYLKLKNIPEAECYNENFCLSNIYSKIYSSAKFLENPTDKALFILLIVSVAFCIFTLIFVVSVPKEGEKFTEFYILNTDGNANWYPVNLTASENFTINVNIVCHEHPAKSIIYKLKIKWNESDEILYERFILLRDNETFSENFTFTANIKNTTQDIAKDNKKLEFLLYKDDNSEIYRKLHLWIDVKI
ncbi:conserved membrane hypothetical protein [groundwater metagenome]|uniref:DUF1616 domain-containing protein n=1 Tax=groundwater metagenome TaxID=717931 RepID=A0A098EAL7_9ZZZZ